MGKEEVTALRKEFEEIYSLSIRRGEDSYTVWEWLNPKLTSKDAEIEGLKERLNDLVYHQQRMVEKWADGDQNVKNDLWKKFTKKKHHYRRNDRDNDQSQCF